MKYLLVLVAMSLHAVWGLPEIKSATESDRHKRFHGQSISTNSKHHEYGRNFEMRVRNHLSLPMENARYATWWGYVSTPPSTIKPCGNSFLAGHKAWGTATGTSGIVSWKIKEKDLTIILLWSVPYDYSLCNSLGLAIYKGLNSSEPSYENRKEYFNDIYHYHESFPSTAVDEDKTINTIYNCNHASEFCTRNAGVSVCGIMSLSSDAKFDVLVSEIDNPLSCAESKQSNARAESLKAPPTTAPSKTTTDSYYVYVADSISK